MEYAGTTGTPPPGGPSVQKDDVPPALAVRRILPEEAQAYLKPLAEILLDAVAGGASVSFVEPFALEDAQQFWEKVLASVQRGETLLLGGWHAGQLSGTVQLRLDTPPNQPHRGDVAKLLVHRRARRLGLGRRLMQALEPLALAHGRFLLTLDTVTGSAAEQLYRSLGYTAVGIIPDYALFPNGELCSTSVFYKRLSAQSH